MMKYFINKVYRQMIYQKKTFLMFITNKGLLFVVCKTVQKFSRNKRQFTKKMENDIYQQLTKEVQIANKS